MEEIREKKQQIRDNMIRKIAALSAEQMAARTKAIENRLFEFANFLESRIALIYTPLGPEVETRDIIRRSFMYNKIIVMPAFDASHHRTALMKVDDPAKDLAPGPRGNLQPIAGRCKTVPMDCIDIAIIPGYAMDEKGARIGSGQGFYDRLIPELPVTTRKVGLVMEDQILPSIPMESHDKHIDIVITETRVIYKI